MVIIKVLKDSLYNGDKNNITGYRITYTKFNIDYWKQRVQIMCPSRRKTVIHEEYVNINIWDNHVILYKINIDNTIRRY